MKAAQEKNPGAAFGAFKGACRESTSRQNHKQGVFFLMLFIVGGRGGASFFPFVKKKDDTKIFFSCKRNQKKPL